jgi:hypothetical protein
MLETKLSKVYFKRRKAEEVFTPPTSSLSLPSQLVLYPHKPDRAPLRTCITVLGLCVMLNIALPVHIAGCIPKYLTFDAKYPGAVESRDIPFYP